MTSLARKPGGGGGGGGAFALGPAQNTFGDDTTADRAAAEALRDAYAAANADWLAQYDANLSFWIRLVWNGGAVEQRRSGAAWQDVTNVIRGRAGTPGDDGAAGGGAFETTGIVLDLTSVAIDTDVLMATGLMLGERGDTPIVPYRLEENAAAWLIIDADRLYDLPVRGSAGDAVSTADATRNAYTLPESAGSSLSGTVGGGLSPAGELLIAFTADDSDTYVEFGRYVTAEAQGLTDAERAELARLAGVEADATADQTGAEIKAAYEAEDDTNAFTDARLGKLAGVATGANRLIPYKIGNIYRAFAAGDAVVKPGNDEGTVAAGGISVAPDNWLLARPEATAALPYVYDLHVYGYETNGVFSVQYGTPNRTDRYVAPSGGAFDLHDDVMDEIVGLSASDRFLVSDESIVGDPNRYVSLVRLQDALTSPAIVRNRLALSEAEVTNMLVNATISTDGSTLTLTKNDGSTVDFTRGSGGTPTATHTSYVGVSDDTAITPAEALAGTSGQGNALTIPAYDGARHVFFARPITAGDFSAVYLYAAGSPNTQNQISAWTQLTSTIEIGGEAHDVIYSNAALTGAGGFIMEVV